MKLQGKFSSFLIYFGIICLILTLWLFWQRHNPKSLAFATTVVESSNSSQKVQTPLRLEILDSGIDLPIVSTKSSEKNWETTDKGVTYLTTSPVPGQLGNSILYGHNWSNLLGNLKKVKPGQIITVTYSDFSKKQFEVKYKMEVSPDDISILDNTADSRITLYTCSGFFDSKRLVVVALLRN